MKNKTTESERPLKGEWRYSDGYLYCGTIRIGALSLDTNPADEVRDEIGEWICEKLNANDREGSDGESLPPLMLLVRWPKINEGDPNEKGLYLVKHIAGYAHEYSLQKWTGSGWNGCWPHEVKEYLLVKPQEAT